MARIINKNKFENKTKEEILEILKSDIGLTHNLEDIGRFVAEDISVPILTDFVLNHPDPVVREGALYGLARHDEKEEVREVIYKVFKNDPYKGLREMARELIEDYHNMICKEIGDCICKKGED